MAMQVKIKKSAGSLDLVLKVDRAAAMQKRTGMKYDASMRIMIPIETLSFLESDSVRSILSGMRLKKSA